MSDTIIKVENLSKKYLLSHLADKREQLFSRLLVNKVKDVGSRLIGSFTRDSVPAQTTEEFWALKDISFEIKQGDRVGIIGSNGAGKSTLLKILSRITEPTKGRITIDGRVASLLEVGTGFHSELSGRENIYLNGAILGMSREEIKRKFDEIVAFAEVERFLDTPVKRYSSGMYVRLAFAVAAHLEPEILIVDEVLAVGDAAFQKKCLGKMEDVSTKEGRTVIFVSHNMSAIRQLCSSGIVLNAGSLITQGPVTDCIDTYMNNAVGKKAAICSHATKINRLIKIDEVTVNGNALDEIQLPFGADLEIEIKGDLLRPFRMEIEAKILDMYEMTLAFFSPGHNKGEAELYPAGSFSIKRRMSLPKNMNNGEYYLSISLTEPNVEVLADMPRAAKLFAEGISTQTGRVIKYSDGGGWLFLQESDD
jgi:lipopolysaccharide transport system ATP-binding protein